MDFAQLLKKRRSTRKLLEKPIEKEKLEKIFSAANSAPSAGNLQAYKIFVIKNEKIKKALTQFGGGTWLSSRDSPTDFKEKHKRVNRDDLEWPIKRKN